MKRQPTQFITVQCLHCGAIVALISPLTLVTTTPMRCSQCATVRRVEPLQGQASDRHVLLTTAQV